MQELWKRWREPRYVALWAATLGFMLDAMDVFLYVFAIASIRTEFHLDNKTAGLATAFTQIFSSGGGVLAGILADRVGRRRALMLTILVYSLASGGTATAQSLWQLLFWRAVVGLGLGGEWSAGALLVAESWTAKHRGKAISFMQSGWAIGYMLAAAAAALVLPRYGWRALFLVGLAPALLTVFIRQYVEEPAVWTQREKGGKARELFSDEFRSRTLLATALATTVLFAYWGLFSWLPVFLSASRGSGGAGLSLGAASSFAILQQAGAYAGYLNFGWMADRFGRRPVFAGYVIAAAVLVPIYGFIPSWAGANTATYLLAAGPVIGFFGTGFFSLFGVMLAELYPTRIRGAGQGFAYNIGRGLSALAPYTVGAIADSKGFGYALALNSGFFLAGALMVFFLPETRQAELSVEPQASRLSQRS